MPLVKCTSMTWKFDCRDLTNRVSSDAVCAYASMRPLSLHANGSKRVSRCAAPPPGVTRDKPLQIKRHPQPLPALLAHHGLNPRASPTDKVPGACAERGGG